MGNRLTSLDVNPYQYNTSNELTSTPSLSYGYDNNGNTKTKTDGTQYNWNIENELTQVTLPGTGGTVNFKYDHWTFTQNQVTFPFAHQWDIAVSDNPADPIIILDPWNGTSGTFANQPIPDIRPVK